MRKARTLVCVGLACAASMAAHKPGGMPDRDGDRIPDAFDPFPDDADRPGKARPNTIYAHSSTTLFTVDAGDGTPTAVADFGFSDGLARQATDMAIDRWGVMYVVAFSTFHTCHPGTGRCETLAELPASFNALTTVGPGVFADGSDGLLGVTTDGRWFRIGRDGTTAELGHHGGVSSGDAYRSGDRIRASRDGARGEDQLIEFDPKVRGSVQVRGPLPGHEMYGFAACREDVFGFDAGGAVYRERAESYERLARTGVAWWGAACSGPDVAFEASAPQEKARPPSPAPAEEPGQPAADSAGRGCGCS